jgi:hypothetical protein
MNVVTIDTKRIENKVMALLARRCAVARCRFSDGQGVASRNSCQDPIRQDQGITWKRVSDQARSEAI